MNLPHLNLLEHIDDIALENGCTVATWRLNIPSDRAILSKWAAHFRKHYCLTSELDNLRQGTGLSRAEFLKQHIFPTRQESLGPAIRAGDFAEILVSDYVQYVQEYWVPRYKYRRKVVPNESIKGVDVMGFRLSTDDPSKHNENDILITYEVKARLSQSKSLTALEQALHDSKKDPFRLAVTLNAAKRHLIELADEHGRAIIERFQNPTDRPYAYIRGAAAVIGRNSLDHSEVKSAANTTEHESHLAILLIVGNDLLALVNALFETAANEA